VTALTSPQAREVLDSAVLCYLAVRTSRGPHLTPVVFVFDGERVWLTTSRSSLKARVWRRDPHVAGLVDGGDQVVIFRGSVRVYDALDPLSWPAAVVAGPRLLRAAARFTAKNARFFAGYAVDAPRVPLAWSPPGRVFASIDMDGGWVLDQRTGKPGEEWGRWPADTDYATSYARPPSRSSLDAEVPQHVRRAAEGSTFGALALQGPLLTVLPVRPPQQWKGPARDAVLPRSFGDLAFVDDQFPAALTVGYASTWRAAEMTGMLYQGRGSLYAMSSVNRGREALRRRIRGVEEKADVNNLALAVVEPSRVVWWDGWSAGTAERTSDPGS
jgi:pyridoxamine 5'-phosphate oxidase-like protein